MKPQAVVLEATQRLSEALELIRVMRAASDVAILVLRDEHERGLSTRILEAGADDCLPADIECSELIARLRSVIRRARPRLEPETGQTVRTGELVLNRETREVSLNGTRVWLTPTEFRLLDALAANLGRPVPHRALLANVWGAEYIGDTHYLRVYIGYLRQKLEQDSRVPRYLLNEWGIGYRLAALPVQVGLSGSGERVVANEPALLGA
jgi:two-component system KDP operon response regulator KdpE